MANERKKTDYEVGYCKPPKHSQWQKGQSGNGGGRPKGSKSLRAVVDEVLETTVTVTLGGKRRRVTKARLIVETAVNEALVSKNFKLLESLGAFKEPKIVEEPFDYPPVFTLKLEDDAPAANPWDDDDFDYSQPQTKPGGGYTATE